MASVLQEAIGDLVAKLHDMKSELAVVEAERDDLRIKTRNARKLSSLEVRQLRFMAAEGVGTQEVADIFQINRATAYRIITRQYYKGIK